MPWRGPDREMEKGMIDTYRSELPGGLTREAAETRAVFVCCTPESQVDEVRRGLDREEMLYWVLDRRLTNGPHRG
jgi:hypothetical protein